MKSADRFSVLFWASWAEFKAMSKPLMTGALLWAALTTAATLAAGDVKNEAAITALIAARVLGFTLVAMLVSYAANVFFMALTLEGRKTVSEAMARILPLAWPVLCMSVWLFLRSFAWLVIVGVALAAMLRQDSVGLPLLLLSMVPAVILLPRFSLGIYILVMEKKGVMQSAAESYRRTAGYWGKIVGNALLLFLIILPVSILSLLTVGVLGGIIGAGSVAAGADPDSMEGALLLSGAIGGVFNGWVTLLISAFSLIFWKHMTRTVTAHPRPAVK